ncbi:hypothetical protein H9P43_007500 [Blastocladiella emersonii ATCC 22665]|nr:hypothetical protein H9P43_007500 [Blastocladiella emersonii ATCC 22665]
MPSTPGHPAAAPAGALPGLSGLACVPPVGSAPAAAAPPASCNPCCNPSTDPRPPNTELLVCRPCGGPLADRGPLLTLPCGNVLHRACVPSAPSRARPVDTCPPYFDCPFACCKLKAHPRPDAVNAGADVVLSQIVAQWAAVRARPTAAACPPPKRPVSAVPVPRLPVRACSGSAIGGDDEAMDVAASVSSSVSQLSLACECSPDTPTILCAYCRKIVAAKAAAAASSKTAGPTDSACGASVAPSLSDYTLPDVKENLPSAHKPAMVAPPAPPELPPCTCREAEVKSRFSRLLDSICPKRAAASASSSALPSASGSSSSSCRLSSLRRCSSSSSVTPAEPAPPERDDPASHKPGCPRAAPPMPELPPPVERLCYSEFEDLLECQLCYQLLHDPITLYPCGHTACRACILRTLDHCDKCFLCRAPLGSYLQYHNQAPNRTLQKFVWHNFPQESWLRAQALAAEARSLLDDVPIFVCSLALPGSPCHLHVFEARYRLMIRRVTAPGAPRLFGMCMSSPDGLPGPAAFGTMMRVEKLQLLPDGRCLVEATGIYPFKVESTSCTDGYTTAKVQQLADTDFLSLDHPCPPELVPMVPAACSADRPDGAPTIRDLVCHASRLLGAFLARLPVHQRHQFMSQFGCMPCDPSLFGYWLAGVLPVCVPEKYKLLQMRSARDRLVTVMTWFRCVRQHQQAQAAAAAAAVGGGGGGCPQAAAAAPAAAPAQPPVAPAPPTRASPGLRTSHRGAARRTSTSTSGSDEPMGGESDEFDDEDEEFDEDEDYDDDEYDDDEDMDMDDDSDAMDQDHHVAAAEPHQPPIPVPPRHPAAPAPAPAAPVHPQQQLQRPAGAPPEGELDACVIM